MLPLVSDGQKDYQSGYIITNDSDTLHGLVKDRKQPPFGRLFKKIRFKDNNIFPKKFGPNQIRGYREGTAEYESLWIVESGRFFRVNYASIPGQGEKQFLKLIIKGPLTYYQQEFQDQESGYFDSVDFFKRNNESEMIRATQGIFGLKRKVLSTYFQDCPELVFRINTRKIKDPVSVVKFYNTWKASFKPDSLGDFSE